MQKKLKSLDRPGAQERGVGGHFPPLKKMGGQAIHLLPHKNGINSIRNYEEIENIIE